MAEVGLVDAELGLHGQTGETDLVAHDPVPGGQLALHVGLLDGVGVAHGQRPEAGGDGRHRGALLLGRPKLLGHRSDGFRLRHVLPPHAFQWMERTW